NEMELWGGDDGRRMMMGEEVRRQAGAGRMSEVKMGGDRPLVAVMKKEKHGAKKKKKDDDSSGMVMVGLSAACVALVTLVGICFCACRDSESSSSPYDLRDEKPLLSLNLSDGPSRKSCATTIDVSRLGALTAECEQTALASLIFGGLNLNLNLNLHIYIYAGHDLPPDLIQTLVRWSPTSDEELRLRLYAGEPAQLGPAEQFMRAIIDVPYLYQRLDALLFMAALPEEAAAVEQSFATLEVACEELRGSRLFKKLLEAVLKTGNRMNDGTFRGGAQAFKLDTLLKLADVKGVDGKTTLLHFVVQEIIRSEGVRAARAASGGGGGSSISSISSSDDLILLQSQSSIGSNSGRSSVDASSLEQEQDETERYRQLGLGVVSSLGDDLQNVRKAASFDADALTITVASLGHRLVKANEFLSTGMRSLEEDSGFQRRLASFVQQSQEQVTRLLEDEKRLRSLVRATVDYFHGSTGKDEGLRLFVVVRDFLGILDKVCREVKEQAAANAKAKKQQQPTPAPRSRQSSQSSFRDPRQQIQDRRAAALSRNNSSSSSSDSDD
uniref:Formin-like protein n=1 Tax=Oryza glaberrima TaxID=4538 RepID=I1PII3_ORYGL